MRLLCSCNINGNKNITCKTNTAWKYEFLLYVDSIAKYRQLATIMAS